MDLEAEPGADAAAGAGEAEAADLRGGHRLPAPAGLEPTRWMGLAHESAWLRRKQNVVPDRADGSWQELSGVRVGPAGLSGRFQRTVQAGTATVPGSARGARRGRAVAITC